MGAACGGIITITLEVMKAFTSRGDSSVLEDLSVTLEECELLLVKPWAPEIVSFSGCIWSCSRCAALLVIRVSEAPGSSSARA